MRFVIAHRAALIGGPLRAARLATVVLVAGFVTESRAAESNVMPDTSSAQEDIYAALEAPQREYLKAMEAGLRDDVEQPQAQSTPEDWTATQDVRSQLGQMQSPGTLAELAIAFQYIDPQRSMEPAANRWVSRISAVLEREFTVLAKVEGRDADGRAIEVNAEWIPGDPSIVAVTPDYGRTVRITVRGAGASYLTVNTPGLWKDLWISATPDQHNVMKVEIAQ